MVQVILAIIFLVMAALAPRVIPSSKVGGMKSLIPVVFGVIALFFIFSTSFVIVDADKVGHLKRIYFGKTMAPGQIIAFEGQKGPLARLLPPGFHFKLFLNVLYDVEELPILEIPEGKYGYVVAKDGLPLGDNEYMAKAWPKEKFKDMLNAEFFLKNGGQKGPQLTVLRPGRYRINAYLFSRTLNK